MYQPLMTLTVHTYYAELRGRLHREFFSLRNRVYVHEPLGCTHCTLFHFQGPNKHAETDSEQGEGNYYYEQDNVFAELPACNGEENEVIHEHREEGKEQDNELDLLPFEPLDTDLICR